MNTSTPASSWWKNQRYAIRFCLTFLAVAGALSLLYAFPYAKNGAVERAFDQYLAAYARAAGALLSLFDSEVRVVGDRILGRYPLQIVKDCDAMDAKILLASAIAAFPARTRDRVIGVIACVFGIFVANLTRIASLYFVGIHAPDSFEFAHRELFPLLLVALAAVLFLGWVRWVRREPAAAAGH
jgi:exosortase/archaeosortase family protein